MFGLVFMGSFFMLCLQGFGIVSAEIPYFGHILVSSISGFGGYLFGKAT